MKKATNEFDELLDLFMSNLSSGALVNKPAEINSSISFL
jgi:hypothetical protein